jgi:hypothetical protein
MGCGVVQSVEGYQHFEENSYIHLSCTINTEVKISFQMLVPMYQTMSLIEQECNFDKHNN